MRLNQISFDLLWLMGKAIYYRNFLVVGEQGDMASVHDGQIHFFPMQQMKETDHVSDITNPKIGVVKNKITLGDHTDKGIPYRGLRKHSAGNGDTICPVWITAMKHGYIYRFIRMRRPSSIFDSFYVRTTPFLVETYREVRA
jgi:hypothetical protein